MMRYAGIIYDDTAAAPGLCLSFYTQGCPIHCKGCHNPETWDEEGGHEFTPDTLKHIKEGIVKNGITRSFAILGGEPLSQHNLFLTTMLVREVRESFPQTPIWIWTGYEMEDLVDSNNMKYILSNINALITGPFIQSMRNVSLPYRGSSNQKVFLFDAKKNLWYNKENKKEEFLV